MAPALLGLALLLLAGAAADGCGSQIMSSAPVFLRAVGRIYSSSDCTGNAAASCGFDSPYSLGPISVAITCPISPLGKFQVAVAGVSATGSSGSCVSVGVASANIDCQPGLLLVLAIVLVLALILGCCCCCCGCCGCCCGGRAARGTPKMYLLLPSGDAASPRGAARRPEAAYAPPQSFDRQYGQYAAQRDDARGGGGGARPNFMRQY